MNAAIEAIYEAAARPERWPQALAAVALVFAAKGAVLIYNRDNGSATAIVSPGLEAALADYNRYWGQHDLAVQRGHERALLSDVGIYTDRDVVSTDEIATHPYYTDFRARHGLKHFMGGSVSPHPKVFVAIGVQGALQAAPFSDADVALLANFGRHIERALRLSIRLIEAETTSMALGDALSKLRAGAIVVDENWRILFANAAAGDLAGGNPGAANWWPHPRPTGSRSPLASALEEALSADSGSAPIVIGRGQTKRPLIAYVLPARFAATDARQFAGAKAVVLLIDQELNAPADPALLRDLLQLTLGEARVASLIGAGKTPKEAAAALGITEETTRTVLKRVYGKVGITHQSALTALLARAALASQS